MSRSKLDNIVDRVPSWRKRFVQKQGDIAFQIRKLLEEKDWTQRKLAEKVDKPESYISRILSGGGENVTVKTLCELEAALEGDIIVTPSFPVSSETLKQKEDVEENFVEADLLHMSEFLVLDRGFMGDPNEFQMPSSTGYQLLSTGGEKSSGRPLHKRGSFK